jgi:hypothetical protein
MHSDCTIAAVIITNLEITRIVDHSVSASDMGITILVCQMLESLFDLFFISPYKLT